MKRLFYIFVSLLGLWSCRSLVIEDRKACPKFVFFDVTNSEYFQNNDIVYNSLYRHPEGDHLACDHPLLREMQDHSYYAEVRRTDAVKGYGLVGWEGMTQSESDWIVPVGGQADTLFRYAYTAPIHEESNTIPVEFVKEHAKVTIQFVGTETFSMSNGKFPFDIVIRSNTCGINAITGDLVLGQYEYRPEETEVGRFQFNLLRQADTDLKMDLYGRPGLYEQEGYLRTFNLYEMLLSDAGITWQEKNLPDLYLVIDLKESVVSVHVDPWEETPLNFDL